MARYHDFDCDQRGPAALANFLGLKIEQVFPILYDVSDCCLGDPSVISGGIPKEPKKKLSRAELMALAMP
jgi:hypothetical protein